MQTPEILIILASYALVGFYMFLVNKWLGHETTAPPGHPLRAIQTSPGIMPHPANNVTKS